MSPFVRFATLFALLSILAVSLAVFAPLPPPAAWAAQLGAGLAVASGVFALLAKRWAMTTDPERAGPMTFWLKVFAWVFVARFLVMGAGLWTVARRGEGELAFVIAFFGCYLLQQWLEISYVLASHARSTTLTPEVSR